MRLPLLVLLALPLSAQTPARLTTFTPGMVVTRSVTFRPGKFFAPGGDSAALTVQGTNIVVDMRGLELIGDSTFNDPDRFSGTAVRILGDSNVTVRGLKAHGYKVGIIAHAVRNLQLFDNDLSYNWKPRLYSGVVKESLADWLDFHHNEHDEWLRYGAAIYLEDVTGGEIRGNIAREGMNGLMMTRVERVTVWNNDFSFNSGVGLGMYRASHSIIMHNRLDWNVRGYSHGFYNRGQDSADLLMYEQCIQNVVAYNSVTHGGDGLFLWAGQSTMDDGRGGANDNLFYGNDFSFAPANGIEATFSRNVFVRNVIEGNWHGIWGGYSYGTTILGNQFRDNAEAISIEHGQDNVIAGNTFARDTVGIHLWWNRIEPSGWGYPLLRDTRSTRYEISYNTFGKNRLAFRIDNTTAIRYLSNSYAGVDTISRVTGDSSESRVLPPVAGGVARISDGYVAIPLRGGIDAMLHGAARRDRSAIIVDEWGPYDWKSPKLWPAGRDDATPLKLRVLGPEGKWRVVSKDGVARLSADSGWVGTSIVVTPAAGREGDFSLILEYRGVGVTTPFGQRFIPGKPVRFSWSRFVPAATWSVKFVAWDSIATRRTDPAAITRALHGPAIATLDTNRLDLTWYAPPQKTIPLARVLTEATTTMRLASGEYLLRTIADDAIRVYLDDKLILDDWTPGESHVKEVRFHAEGSHRFRVEHLQIEGWYELRLDIERAP